MITNDTPHTIKFFRREQVERKGFRFALLSDSEQPYATIEPSGYVARVTTVVVDRDPIGEVPASFTAFGEIDDLPAPDGTIHIVSSICAKPIERLGRTDFATVQDTVADSTGKIVGCLGVSLISA